MLEAETELQVEVTNLDSEGRGVGTAPDNGEVRVRGALPGEQVLVNISHRSKGGRRFGEVASIVKASDDRVESACERFLDCGGCDFLHASIAAQHAFKREAVAEALGLPLEGVEPVVASPSPLGYRGLGKFVANGYVLGSYRPRSHDIADMSGCAVHAPIVEAIADALRAELRERLVQLRYVLIRASLHEQRAVVTLVARTKQVEAARTLAETIGARPDVARVVINVNDTTGNALVVPDADIVVVDGHAPSERIGDIEQSLSAGAFAQVNPGAAAALYAVVTEHAEIKGRRALDLYSGSGGIALTLGAAGAAAVHGIETSLQGVDAAVSSAMRLKLAARVRFSAASVEGALEDAPEADVIVMNPPRKGASPEVLAALAERRPFRLIYVSCNPISLARDIDTLRAAGPLQFKSVTPVDLFPQTRHVETVLVADLPA